MAIPSANDVLTMNWSYAGLPFVDVPTNNTVNTQTMNWAYAGLPFVTNLSVTGPLNIGGWDGVNSSNIQAITSVTYANLQTINGVS